MLQVNSMHAYGVISTKVSGEKDRHTCAGLAT